MDQVPLQSRISRQKDQTKDDCACEHYYFHTDKCKSTKQWIVRVWFETQAGKQAHTDSVRLSRPAAESLHGEYSGLKAKILRVYPLYR